MDQELPQWHFGTINEETINEIISETKKLLLLAKEIRNKTLLFNNENSTKTKFVVDKSFKFTEERNIFFIKSSSIGRSDFFYSCCFYDVQKNKLTKFLINGCINNLYRVDDFNSIFTKLEDAVVFLIKILGDPIWVKKNIFDRYMNKKKLDLPE